MLPEDLPWNVALVTCCTGLLQSFTQTPKTASSRCIPKSGNRICLTLPMWLDCGLALATANVFDGSLSEKRLHGPPV